MKIVSLGECMIELSIGAQEKLTFGYAGDTLNTAWYLRALLPQSCDVEYMTALGDDHHSASMQKFFETHGLGTSHIKIIKGRQPGLYIIHQADGDRQFTYWRGQSAAKLLAEDKDALGKSVSGAALVYFSGITMAILDQAGRNRLLGELRRVRQQGSLIAFDPNIRPRLWSSVDELRSSVEAAAKISDIILPTFGDEKMAFIDSGIEAVAERYLSWGAKEVVVKNGAEPTLVAIPEGRFWSAAKHVNNVVDPTGAGDSFNAAYLAARLSEVPPHDAAAKGHQLAGSVITEAGALISMEKARAAYK